MSVRTAVRSKRIVVARRRTTEVVWQGKGVAEVVWHGKGAVGHDKGVVRHGKGAKSLKRFRQVCLSLAVRAQKISK